MTLPTHALAGLIIGRITGDFSTALIGSLIIDADHAISYIRHGMLFTPKKLFRVICDRADPWGDQRSILHSMFSFITISLFLFLLNAHFAFVFSIAYFFHLVLDALDSSDFYPLFPFRKFVLKGRTEYHSKQELTLDICLIFIVIGLFIV